MENQTIDQTLSTRPASKDELARMKSHVVWIYEKGQAVVLWEESGFISLAPATLPARGVTLLMKPANSRH